MTAAVFQGLKQALWTWTCEALDQFEGAEPLDLRSFPNWALDSDGVFRYRERRSAIWPPEVDLEVLPSWRAVLKAISEEPDLSRQFDQAFSTAYGSAPLEPRALGLHVLPKPDEVDRADEIFEERYQEFEEFLLAKRLSCVAVWPLPGLSLESDRVVLEKSLELGRMSEAEIIAALKAGLLSRMHPPFGPSGIFSPTDDLITCLRYRFTLPKIIGREDSTTPVSSMSETINQIEETFEQTTALLPWDFPISTGRVQLAAQWTPSGQGYSFAPNLRSLLSWADHDLREHEAAELHSVWTQLRSPHLPKELRLAARRFGFRRERHRPEDRLVDILVAAESLYVPREVRTELTYRLALNAARYCDPRALQMTRREAFDLMQNAYGIRSNLVHGDTSAKKYLKIKGERAQLVEVMAATEDVVRQALRQALQDAMTGSWPPDWIAMLLSD